MRDALTQPATPAQIAAFASRRGISDEKARTVLERLREKQIAARAADPFNNGYEPEIWLVTKALMRKAVISSAQRVRVKREFGLEWDEFAGRIRERLGFAHPVSEILIMGANRSGKTDFCAKDIMQTCWEGGRSVNVAFQSLATGKQIQMPRMWNYMHNEWKARNVSGKKSTDINEHISYNKQNGFSNSKITFGNGSDVRFLSYEMDTKTNWEGSALDKAWLDEETPKDVLDAARFRLASKGGVLMTSFTPVSGYTPVVADYLNDLVVVRYHTAWMIPIDGGEPMPWKELGLEESEYRELIAWRDEGSTGDLGIPESRPEPIAQRLLDPGTPVDIDEIPDGRAFGLTERIGKCRGGDAAVVWFYGRDNPYGTPSEVIKKAMQNQNAAKEIKCRVYGTAERIKGRLLPEFNRKRHVIDDADLPKRLVRIHVCDPAPERNWTNGWHGYEPETDIYYIYRDWPGSFEIPGVGFPGPWAVPSGRNMGINDGDRGDAQEPFGFGYLSYKFEWARLERWKNYLDWLKLGHSPSERCEDWDELEEWSETDGVTEPIEMRIIDARAGSQSKINQRESVSLFDDVSKLAEGFQPASGQKIDVGTNVIRDRLATDRLKVCASCVNTIFALETWCGADKQKGAVKDFIDLIRYGVLSGVCDSTPDMAREVGPAARPAAASALPAGRRRFRVSW